MSSGNNGPSGRRPHRGNGGRRPESGRESGRGARRSEGRDEGIARDRARPERPALPVGVELSDLDPEVRRELATLPKGLAELVGGHLVAVGRTIDEDPRSALEHARFARSRAGRVAAVREAAGLAAYQAGEWSEALAELRATRRLSGRPAHLAVLADCERALGRPERALEIARSADAAALGLEEAVELRIVAAGARRDLGQLEAAVVGLQGPELDSDAGEPWVARLRYAYADNLLAAGRSEEALRWFVAAADADADAETDAADRAAELGGQVGQP